MNLTGNRRYFWQRLCRKCALMEMQTRTPNEHK